MSGLFGGAKMPPPPPPPPPPANPPQAAAAAPLGPLMSTNPFLRGFDNSIFTSPSGVANNPAVVGNKTLLGQ